MPTTLSVVDPVQAEEIITRWLTDTSVDGWENPAGDLFTGGEYALQEITMTISPPSSNCSSCTGSRPIACC
ncbi:hypothetical protein GA0070616_0538 [Micromonospora nigra]|uniref:Uncharacterized protein n=1 Tax=Micromonospora nigra TaxID=145857 RepID=A0A1C6RCB4_9ACTN|nr:DUF6229 family protein [Micromonospora nigra]SCL14783.1 hypothetical protein GA0070616_0538 [Micromonospora nigra]